MNWVIAGEERMLAAGAALARACPPGGVTLYIIGDLGAGKTTLVRGFMRGLGYAGTVKSPTYTLLESYEIAGRLFHHFDLYRVADADELEYIGIRDCLGGDAVLLIEWPERGGTHLPPPDVVLTLQHLEDARRLRSEPRTALGETFMTRFEAALQSTSS